MEHEQNPEPNSQQLNPPSAFQYNQIAPVSQQPNPPPAHGYNHVAPVSQQPMGQPPPLQQAHQSNTTVVVNQQIERFVRPPARTWSTGAFGCFSDMSSCCGVCLCGGCCYPCYLSDKLGESCCLPICLPGNTWLLALRVKMRAENNIMGSIMDDSSMVCCCAPCMMCQLSREHENIKSGRA
ncbi:cornifelin homolog A-like isoform X2 [Ostrea edulis]|uniref:cornifelin homolog A-like isoform X2 n=1 Tax=Ostrea edulis TaxID=37623 RepID=UPI0024AF3B7A|nr:cornifelin homolog A-like isoform X2 [Ostrea edulis]